MKVLATDYDGTLRRGEFITIEDKAAINKWRLAGNLFGIITGRGYPSIMEEISTQKVECDFLICNNGCVIKDKSSDINEQFTADGAVLTDLVNLIIEHGGRHAAISKDDQRILVDIGMPSHIKPYEIWINLNEVKDFDYFSQLDTVFGKEDLAKKFADMINSQFGEYVTAHQNGICVDMVPAGWSKPAGLLHYLKLKNISKSNAITVGDNLNDIGMIVEFGGYAVANANPAVLPFAQRIFANIAEIVEYHLKGL
ncbi:MAG TPA: HAD-IIB family hydrolase [Clostridiales bacterium]|nr:HAD-IIB family hydrolase [Clostridiales bacterium]